MKHKNSRREFLHKVTAGSTMLGGASLIPSVLYAESNDDQKSKAPERAHLPLKIWLASGLSAELEEELRAISPEIILYTSGQEKRKILPEIQACFGFISEDDLRLSKNLKWVHSPSAGVEKYLYPEMMSRDILLSNAKGCYAPAIAEHTIGLLFSLTRGIKEQTLNMTKHKWAGVERQVEMRNMTMGIIGFGGIGREIGRRAKAFDLKVLAADIRPMSGETTGNIADELYAMEFGGFEKVLENSNIVVCAAPHTPVSEGMFNESVFRKMPKGSYFINISRGKLVKTNDLMRVLGEGHLAGAGLDVTDPEPLPENHKLWDYKNVIVTSHISGRSQYSSLRSQQVFVTNVRRYVQGLPLLNQVDKKAGF